MRLPTTLPDLAIVRVLSDGGPYRRDQTLSIAFTVPTIGRLVAHEVSASDNDSEVADPLVPETIATRVTHAAGPYAVGDVLTLSFIDPRVARIHSTAEVVLEACSASIGDATSGSTLSPAVRPAPPYHGSPVQAVTAVEAVADVDPALRATGVPVLQPAATDVAPTTIASDGAVRSAPDDASGPRPADAAAVQHETEPASGLPSADTAPLPPAADTAPLLPVSADATGDGLTRNVPYDPALSSESEQNAAPLLRQAFADPQLPAESWPFATATPAACERTNGRGCGVEVRLVWSPERVRRFVQVVDKLFTVGRLGWYRHALAMRLLVPDVVTCGDSLADLEAMRHLHALRAAAIEALGRPLLAAFMPNFAVTAPWLATIDSPAAARSLAGLRDALLPYVDDDVVASVTEREQTVGMIRRDELLASTPSVEAFLPVLIPSASPHESLSERLDDYRRVLIDAFGQTARSAEPVRVNQMAQPNHALDDRLWRLVGAVGEAFTDLAVA